MLDPFYPYKNERSKKLQYLTLVNNPPSNHPVTVDEAKLYCKVDTTADDDVFEILVHAAVKAIENECGGLAIVKRTFTQKQTGGLEVIELMREPLVSLTSVTFAENFNSTPTTITSQVRTLSGQLIHENGYFKQGRDGDGYVIQFVAGLVDDTNQAHLDAPQILRTAILRMIAFLYEQRQEFARSYSEGSWKVDYSEVPEAIKRLVMPYHISKGVI